MTTTYEDIYHRHMNPLRVEDATQALVRWLMDKGASETAALRIAVTITILWSRGESGELMTDVARSGDRRGTGRVWTHEVEDKFAKLVTLSTDGMEAERKRHEAQMSYSPVPKTILVMGTDGRPDEELTEELNEVIYAACGENFPPHLDPKVYIR